MDTNAGFEGARVGIQPLEGWKEGGMDVEKPVLPAGNEPGGEDAHEACETDKLDPGGLECSIQGLLERLPAVMGFVVDHQVRDTGSIGACETACSGLIGDHQGDVIGGVRPLAGFDQGAQIGTAPGNQDRNPLRRHRLARSA